MKSTGKILIVVATFLAACVGCGRPAPPSPEPKATQPAAGVQGSGSRATPTEEPAQVQPGVTDDQSGTPKVQPQGPNTNLP